MKNFISVKQLKKVQNNDNLLTVDCRFDLKNPFLGLEEYKKSHIENSVYIDLNKSLSNPISKHGGRNPLIDGTSFIEEISNLGINKDTIVVAYDNYRISSAARFIWMLRYIGHKNNYILDGGFEKWINEKGAISHKINKVNKKSNLTINKTPIYIDRDELLETINKGEKVYIIDSRTKERYLGISEPIDKKAGSIINSHNHYWKDLLNHDYTINLTKTKKEFKHLKSQKNIVLYCGSGIDACFNFLLLDELMISSKVYIGSWSDWISYPNIEDFIQFSSK